MGIEESTTPNSNSQEEADPTLHASLNAQRETETASPVGIPSVLNEDARGLLESSAQILVSIGKLTIGKLTQRQKRGRPVKILKISIK